MIIKDIRQVLSLCKMIDITLGEYTVLVEMLKIRIVKIQGKRIAVRKEKDNQKSTVLQKLRKCHQDVKDE